MPTGSMPRVGLDDRWFRLLKQSADNKDGSNDGDSSTMVRVAATTTDSAYLRVALGLYINERSALKAVPCFAPCHAEAALTGYSTKRNISPEKTMTLLPMMNHSVFPSIFMATSTVAAALPTQTSTPPSGKDHNSSTYFCVRLTATVEKPRRTSYDSTVGIVQVP